MRFRSEITLKCYRCGRASSYEEVETATRDGRRYWVCPHCDFETPIVDGVFPSGRRSIVRPRADSPDHSLCASATAAGQTVFQTAEALIESYEDLENKGFDAEILDRLLRLWGVKKKPKLTRQDIHTIDL